MNTELQKLCERFVENESILRTTFRWDSQTMALAASTVFIGQDQPADADRLKQCEKILLDHSKGLSELRGTIKLPLLSKMAVSSEPEQYLLNVDAVDQRFNQSKWLGNTHMLLAAMTLCDHIDIKDAEHYVDKTGEIMGRMREKHKWITSDDDIPFAAMLAVSGIDVDRLIDESENCYSILKEKFGVSNANTVQALCHILALNEKSAEEKCAKVSKIYDRLKEEKHKLGVGQELACLGLLALLDTDTEIIVREVIEADDYLKPHKGFGNWDAGSSIRRMYAAIAVMELHKQDGTAGQNAAIGDMLAVSVAIEVCTVVMLTLLMHS